jgi:hypothetical protein
MPGRARRIASFALLLGCTFRAPVHGDGGAVQFRRRSGPFVITLFSSPVPLRTGAADLSVLVESVDGNQPVLDATVGLDLSQPGTHLTLEATHAQATNKLLYAALPEIPRPGNWAVTVSVKRADLKAATTGNVTVLPGSPALVAYWPYFAIVPCLIALFVVNQILKSKTRRNRM